MAIFFNPSSRGMCPQLIVGRDEVPPKQRIGSVIRHIKRRILFGWVRHREGAKRPWRYAFHLFIFLTGRLPRRPDGLLAVTRWCVTARERSDRGDLLLCSGDPKGRLRCGLDTVSIVHNSPAKLLGNSSFLFFLNIFISLCRSLSQRMQFYI